MKHSANLHYRLARSADIGAMSAIRLSVTENVLSDPAKVTAQMYRDYMEALGRAWVCEADGKVVGFCYAVRADASIWALFLDSAHEGRGIATRLLDMACDWLRDIGKTQAVLSTTPDTRADRFYAARGWQRAEPVEGNEVFFSRQLQPMPGISVSE